MKEYRYEVVVTGWLGSDDPMGKSVSQINKLLQEGWEPVRESPMGSVSFPPSNQDGMAYKFASLVVLERDAK